MHPPVPEHHDAPEVQHQPRAAERVKLPASEAGHAEDRAGSGAEAVVVAAHPQLEIKEPRQRRQVQKPVRVHDLLGKHPLFGQAPGPLPRKSFDT